MPISVTGPDNVTVSFPDGTDASIINDVMMKHFGGGQAQSKTSPITTGNLASAALDLPVVGPVARKADAAIQAAIAPYRSGNKGIMELSGESLPESGWGERYSHALKSIEAPLQKFEEEHPVAAGLANVAGTTAATLPLAATGVGRTLLGLGGRTFGQEALRGAVSGAGINAADALARGNDPGTAAIVGGGVGGAFPIIGRAAGGVASRAADVARAVTNPAEYVGRRVGEAIESAQQLAAATPGNVRNPLTPQQFDVERAANRPVMVMDMAGEQGRALARSAANLSPEARATLNQAIDPRFEGQSERISDEINSMMHYPNAPAQAEALRQSQSAVDNPNYARAMRDGDRSIWSPALERLASSPAVMDAMRKAIPAVGNESVIGGYAGMNPRFSFSPDGRLLPGRGPTGAPIYPNLQFWDMTRKQLSDAANQAEARQQNTAFRQLSLLSQQMNTALDAEVPSYAAARAGHAAFAGAQDALQAGQRYATQQGFRIDNFAARNAKNQMTPQEQQLFEDGFTSALVNRIRSVPDRQNVLNKIANSPVAQEQLRVGLGSQDRVNRLMAYLHLEGVMDAARPAVQGNSTTVRQLAELGLASAGGSAALTGSNPFTDPTAFLTAALMYGGARGGRSALNTVNRRIAEQTARLLTSPNRAGVRMGAQMLGNNQNLLRNLRNTQAAIARSVSSQLQPSPSNQQATP